MQRIPSLDGLRAISISLVLFGHLSGTKYFPIQESDFLSALANLGVRVFFVISGFLITGLLLREETISLKNFYIRRSLRIFPAFYVFIAVMLLVKVSLAPHDLAYALTYTINYDFHRAWYFGHLWSLAVEEQFYFLWPAILYFGGRRFGVKAAVAMVLVAPLLRELIWLRFPALTEGVGTMFPTVADAIACGCLLALCREWLWKQKSYREAVTSWALIAMLGFIANLAYNHPKIHALTASVLNICIALLIDYCLRFPPRFLNWKPVANIGLISYSLYLWQQPFLNRESSALWNTFPINILCVFACALLSYLLVEKTFLLLRHLSIEDIDLRIKPNQVRVPTIAARIGIRCLKSVKHSILAASRNAGSW